MINRDQLKLVIDKEIVFHHTLLKKFAINIMNEIKGIAEINISVVDKKSSKGQINEKINGLLETVETGDVINIQRKIDIYMQKLNNPYKLLELMR